MRWSPAIRQDLLWWLDRERLELGISLEQVSPQLDLWSDASDVGWGAHLGEEVVSGLWSPEECLSSINHWELLAVFYALQHFPACSQCLGSGVRRQHDGAGLPEESGGYQIRRPEPDGSGSAALGGALFYHSSTTIYHGAQQCVGGCSISPESDSGLRMDLETVCVSTASEKVAGVDRPFRNLTKSPLFTLFFSVPRSQFHWDRCSSPTMGWVAGVCLSSLCADPCDSEKAPPVLWGPADDHSSLLAPEAVVSGASGVSGGRSSALPLDRDLLSQPHVHRQHLGLSRLALHAWRLSSDLRDRVVSPGMWPNRRRWLDCRLPGRGTSLNGLFIGGGVPRKAIPSLGLLCPRLQIFFFGFVDPKSFRFQPLWGIG